MRRLTISVTVVMVAATTACAVDRPADPPPPAITTATADPAPPATVADPAPPTATADPAPPGTAADPAPPTAGPAPPATAADPAPPTATAADPAASEPRFAVGRRHFDLVRGDRPLRTLLLYPAAGADTDPIRTGAAPAGGRFPLVLFSHGLHGSPERYEPAAAGWASAGFVVALPAYPHTHAGTTDFRRRDIRNQPADAAYVIRKVRRLDGTAGDPLSGRIDGGRVAAVGHSAGGYTTNGLFTAGHDARLRAGVVLAGWMAPGAFHGPPATMLFIHGDSDPVVPEQQGRAAYDRVPWPKAYVLLPRNHHAAYMLPGNRGFPEMESLVTDFLRWTLRGDETAGARFAGMVRNSPGDPGTMGA
jgi:dienelactone hydrolase